MVIVLIYFLFLPNLTVTEKQIVDTNGYHCGPKNGFSKYAIYLGIYISCGSNERKRRQNCCKEHDYCYYTSMTQQQCDDVFINCFNGGEECRVNDKMNSMAKKVRELGHNYKKTECFSFQNEELNFNKMCEEKGSCNLNLTCKQGVLFFTKKPTLTIDCVEGGWLYRVRPPSDMIIHLSKKFLEGIRCNKNLDATNKKSESFVLKECASTRVRSGETCKLYRDQNYYQNFKCLAGEWKKSKEEFCDNIFYINKDTKKIYKDFDLNTDCERDKILFGKTCDIFCRKIINKNKDKDRNRNLTKIGKIRCEEDNSLSTLNLKGEKSELKCEGNKRGSFQKKSTANFAVLFTIIYFLLKK